MRIRVLSRSEVEAGGAEGADAIISIRHSAGCSENDLDVALAQACRGESARLLRLVFDDIGMPTYGHFVGPTMEQISEAIEFGRAIVDGRHLFDGPSADPAIAIHCEHGKSRSAAIALALLADQYGAGNEREAVNALLRADTESRMHPNPLVVSLADTCLFRYGRIDAALAEASPAYVWWRGLWREIAADPEAHWERASRILSGHGRR
jgi:predicted protein tyrosine phosphatase